MIEPDVLNAKIECPDCDGTGEVKRTVPAGPFGYDGQDDITEDCEACHGSGTLRLGDLEKPASENNSSRVKGIFQGEI